MTILLITRRQFELLLMACESKVKGARIIAVLEPRSNTMKMGVWKESLADSLSPADEVFCYKANLGWEAGEALAFARVKEQRPTKTLNDLIAAIKTADSAGGSRGGYEQWRIWGHSRTTARSHERRRCRILRCGAQTGSDG